MIQAECGVVSKGGLEPLQRPKQMLTVRAAPVRRGQKKMVSKGDLHSFTPAQNVNGARSARQAWAKENGVEGGT